MQEELCTIFAEVLRICCRCRASDLKCHENGKKPQRLSLTSIENLSKASKCESKIEQRLQTCQKYGIVNSPFCSLDSGGDDRHFSHFFRGLARGETGDFRQVHGGGGGEGEEGRGRRRRSHERRRGYATRPKLPYRMKVPMLNQSTD